MGGIERGGAWGEKGMVGGGTAQLAWAFPWESTTGGDRIAHIKGQWPSKMIA